MYDLTFNGKTLSINDKNLAYDTSDPYNPLNLPPYTMRVKFLPGTAPSAKNGGTFSLVSQEDNIWDYNYKNDIWWYKFSLIDNITDIIGANVKNVKSFMAFFTRCSALSSVSLFDTRNADAINGFMTYCPLISSLPNFSFNKATNASFCFSNLSNLTAIPKLEFHSITNANNMFAHDVNVQDGISAMYSALSSLGGQITSHSGTFSDCGTNTTATAQLALIPADWK